MNVFPGASAVSTTSEPSTARRLPNFSRHVLTARPDRLAVLPVRGVHWNDLGDPKRVLATRRRAQAMPMREPILEPISA
jgi:hypothetical protein